MHQEISIDVNEVITSYERVVGKLQTQLVISELKSSALEDEIENLHKEIEILQRHVSYGSSDKALKG